MDTQAPNDRAWPVRDTAAIGAWIRDARFQLGMTQQDLAEKMGVDRQYVSEIERGKDTEHIVRLFKAFKVLGITMSLSEASDV